jgi:hypothetical protein
VSAARKQVHAPPTTAELATSLPRKPTARRLRTWTSLDGWCSACPATYVRVAHMGVSERHFALCAPCVARLAKELEKKR